MFLWDFVVEVSFGAGGGSFKSVCILAGVIFCLDVGLRGLRLVSVVVECAFCDVLVDVFLDFLFFSRDCFGRTWVAGRSLVSLLGCT